MTTNHANIRSVLDLLAPMANPISAKSTMIPQTTDATPMTLISDEPTDTTDRTEPMTEIPTNTASMIAQINTPVLRSVQPQQHWKTRQPRHILNG